MKRYTPEENFIIQSNSHMTLDELATLLKRSRGSVHFHCSYMGFDFKRKGSWTKAEDELMREKFPDSTEAELLKLFPGRTIIAIRSHAHLMGIYKSAEYVRRVFSKSNSTRRNYKGGNRAIACVRLDTKEIFPMIKKLAKSLNVSSTHVGETLRTSRFYDIEAYVRGVRIAYVSDLPCGMCQHCFGIDDDERLQPDLLCGCRLDSSIKSTSDKSCSNFQICK